MFVGCFLFCGLNVVRGGISDLHNFAKWPIFLHIRQASFFAGQIFRFMKFVSASSAVLYLSCLWCW